MERIPDDDGGLRPSQGPLLWPSPPSRRGEQSFSFSRLQSSAIGHDDDQMGAETSLFICHDSREKGRGFDEETPFSAKGVFFWQDCSRVDER
jgi:hypothetical protein